MGLGRTTSREMRGKLKGCKFRDCYNARTTFVFATRFRRSFKVEGLSFLLFVHNTAGVTSRTSMTMRSINLSVLHGQGTKSRGRLHAWLLHDEQSCSHVYARLNW